MKLEEPNHVHGLDITYIRLARGWLYLVAVLDWYSRYIVSWELADSLHLDFVIKAVERGFASSKPLILNSDQGSHFTSLRYRQLVETAGVKITPQRGVDGRGRAFDNIFTERLWRTIKSECVFLNEFGSPKEARQGLGTYIRFYNEQRPHQSLGYQTPSEVHFAQPG